MYKLTLSILMLSLFFISCREEGSDNITSSADEPIRSSAISVTPDNVGLIDNTNLISVGKLPFLSSMPIFIIGRPSKNCEWIGYCGRAFKWPWELVSPDSGPCVSNCREAGFSITWDNSNNLLPIELHLDGDISNAPIAQQKFYVEDDIIIEGDGNPFIEFVIPIQTIDRDASLGQFGGYLITVTGTLAGN